MDPATRPQQLVNMSLHCSMFPVFSAAFLVTVGRRPSVLILSSRSRVICCCTDVFSNRRRLACSDSRSAGCDGPLYAHTMCGVTYDRAHYVGALATMFHALVYCHTLWAIGSAMAIVRAQAMDDLSLLLSLFPVILQSLSFNNLQTCPQLQTFLHISPPSHHRQVKLVLPRQKQALVNSSDHQHTLSVHPQAKRYQKQEAPKSNP